MRISCRKMCIKVCKIIIVIVALNNLFSLLVNQQYLKEVMQSDLWLNV